MRIPSSLTSLAEYGMIEEVLRPLMSGKEAQIYAVRSGGEYRVAKVYKEAQNRTFKNRAAYTEGRKVRNTRDQRAMSTRSRHGRAQAEAAWRTTEVDMIYRLREAGVRVPQPYHFVDGVLVMEMITDEHGDPAPRLGDVVLEREAAQAVFDRLLAEVVRMLAAGVVHGDLSDFNVLMGKDGPVIIDFPQAVDASSNQNARQLLLRDVDNLHRFMARIAPERRALPYAQEMWALYERGLLAPDTKLTGRYRVSEKKVSADDVLGLIGDAARDERRRREHLGLSMRGTSDAEPSRPPSRYAQKREAQVAARMLEAASNPPAQRSAQRTPHEHASHKLPRPRGADHAHAQREAAGQAASRPRSTSNAPSSRANVGQHPQRDSGRPASTAQDRSTRFPKPRAPQAVPHPRPEAADHARPRHAEAHAAGGETAQKRRRRRRRRKAGAGL